MIQIFIFIRAPQKKNKIRHEFIKKLHLAKEIKDYLDSALVEIAKPLSRCGKLES